MVSSRAFCERKTTPKKVGHYAQPLNKLVLYIVPIHTNPYGKRILRIWQKIKLLKISLKKEQSTKAKLQMF